METPSILPKAALALLAAVAIPIAATNAQTAASAPIFITFPIDGTEGATQYSVEEDGITLLLTNPTNDFSDGDFAFGNDSVDSAAGHPGVGELNLSSPQGAYTTGFNLSFNSSVKVVSYVIGVQDGTTGGTFSLSQGGTTTSSGNTLAVGSDAIEGTFILGANALGTFSTGGSIPASGLPSLESITIEIVPEPATWTFLGLGSVAAAFMARRRRRANIAG